MGLSSSQGRLLMLTSRLSDIELQQMLISQRQNALAASGQKAAEEYNNALTNCKIMMKVPNSSEKTGYTKEDLSYKNLTQMGYLATNGSGAVYMQKVDADISGEIILESLNAKLANATTDEEKAAIQAEIDDVTQKITEAEANGEEYTQKATIWDIPTDINGNPLLELSADGTKAIVNGEEVNILDGTSYFQDPKILNNMIVNGMMFIHNTNNNVSGITMEMLESNTQMLYELDTTDDAAAQSKYEYELASIERKENQLEMEMAQLETQHEAVLKELESVKNVISNNVERTFKLFSNG